MKIKKIAFQGWKNCIELTHGDFRIVVTTEVGPRIVGAFLGPKGENLLYLDKKLLGTSNQKVWTNYGGHRIWHAPEDSVRSYCPDTRKVVVAELRDGGVSFMAPREELTGIVKTINVYPEGDNSFRIEHQIRNEGLWDIEAAAWGITQLMPGGTAILPMNHGPEGLVPNRSVNFWPYARPSDPRFVYGNEFVLVKQTAKGAPTKIGLNSSEGCARTSTTTSSSSSSSSISTRTNIPTSAAPSKSTPRAATSSSKRSARLPSSNPATKSPTANIGPPPKSSRFRSITTKT